MLANKGPSKWRRQKAIKKVCILSPQTRISLREESYPVWVLGRDVHASYQVPPPLISLAFSPLINTSLNRKIVFGSVWLPTWELAEDIANTRFPRVDCGTETNKGTQDTN
ncbi:unnamed protein product [Protopolystoma xenopodis]|uniref:Uncharacterized protein n=1 Tax=Protopolystoma xenopodis TaxID=117903 RepID=A0A3S5BHP6_9PLAT|nr:unnamed protein product [Protopolystoma xenopodis]